MDWMMLFRNCMTLLSISGIFVELLFLLLLFTTRKTVHSYALFLAPNCIFDLLFLISWAPFRVDLLVDKSYLIIGITIFDTELSPSITKAIALLLSFSCNLALSVLFIPFYLRFLMICKKQRISLPGKLLLYLVAVVLNLIVVIILGFSYKVSPTELEHLQRKPDMSGEYWNFVAAHVVSRFFHV